MSGLLFLFYYFSTIFLSLSCIPFILFGGLNSNKQGQKHHSKEVHGFSIIIFSIQYGERICQTPYHGKTPKCVFRRRSVRKAFGPIKVNIIISTTMLLYLNTVMWITMEFQNKFINQAVHINIRIPPVLTPMILHVNPLLKANIFQQKKKKEKKERASFETCTECISINRKIRSTYVCCMGNKIKTKMCIVKLGALCSFVWCFAYSREGKSKVYCNSITKLTPTYGKWNDQCWMKNSRWQHWIGSNIFISQLHPYNA